MFTSENNVYRLSHLFKMLKFRLNVFETIDFLKIHLSDLFLRILGYKLKLIADT